MNTQSSVLVPQSSTQALPLPNINVTIRPGVLSDVPFLDALQKLHTKQVGWMPTKQFEGKIKLGHVLIAESNGENVGQAIACRDGEPAGNSLPYVTDSIANCKSQIANPPTPVGYCIGNDQYFKRDDVGIIYQMNVLPGKQRGLIGASLLKAMFERSAYGCKLYCCWCAQDIAANKFWEAMGFVPLAYRAGSEKKSRTHIFWQKRIRSGDCETPWWFPSKTAGGSIREDRIVLPIPPGTHWSDAKPMILPGEQTVGQAIACRDSGERQAIACPTKSKREKTPKAAEPPKAIRRNGLMFDIPKQGEPSPEAKPVKAAKLAKAAQTAKVHTPKVKRICDPRLVSAARELRDRWLEQVNASPLLSQGKYEVTRAIDDQTRVKAIEPMKLLSAA